MMKFTKVEYKPLPPPPKPAGECPECGSGLFYGYIPCPERLKGCLVLHYGYSCSRCGSYFYGTSDD